ncbi:MAG: DUF995 domain-containing protein [Aestuariivirga sp.]|nr:DUF995 domain-containing protein [Aestuariivirga sp.]
MNHRACAAILLISLGLAACVGQQDQSFAPPAAPTGLTQADINNILSGKSWRWSGPNNSGVTLYASDGTSLVEVSGKGTTTGTWSAKDGQLCEAFAPAPFLPKGVALNCQPITGSGNVYQVGQATFTLA